MALHQGITRWLGWLILCIYLDSSLVIYHPERIVALRRRTGSVTMITRQDSSRLPHWAAVPLGELLVKSEDEVRLDPEQWYRLLTVGWWGKGVVERKKCLGSEIASAKLFRVCPNQFIISRIDARKGACDVIPSEYSGAVVTNDFPVYSINYEKLLPAFLKWFSKTEQFVRLCEQVSEGTTNRVRLKEARFLTASIPFPPLPEQQRIVARIEELVQKVDQARRFAKEALQECALLESVHSEPIYTKLASTYSEKCLGTFNPHVTSGPRSWATHYVKAGVRFYRAQDVLADGTLATTGKVFIEPPDSQQGTGARLRPGDVLLVITGATVGRVGVFTEQEEPGFVSQHVAVCRLPLDEVEPRYVLWGLRCPQGQAQLLGKRYGQGKPGLNLTNIRKLMLPFPPLCVQRRVVSDFDCVRERLSHLCSAQRERLAEMDALLPAILDKAFRGEL